MKRKKSAALTLSGPRWDAAMVALFSIFLFFMMTLWTERAAVAAAFVALLLVVGRTPWRLARERFSVPVLGLLGFMLMNGLAAVYSPFGGSAVRDFSSILPAFALSALVLLRFEKRHVRGLLWGIAAVCAAVSLLSTSWACEGPLFEGFLGLMDWFQASGMYGEIESSVSRINGIYNDANITGSLFALGSLIALYLTQTGEKWWARLASCVLVSVNAVGLLLSVSRGAILCFGVSLLAWLAAAGKEQRTRLFLLMVVSAGTCLATFMPASLAVAPGAVVPNILALCAGGVVFLLDRFLVEPLSQKLAGHGKIVAGGMIALVLAAGGLAVMAFHLTEPFVFEKDKTFYRGVPLSPGEYTLSLDLEGAESSSIVVFSRSELQALTSGRTYLYSGDTNTIAFSVPEDSIRVYFQLWSSDGSILQSAVLSDGTELPLAYRLLPEMLVRRLQENLLQDNSFLLRAQYDKDALKLIKQGSFWGYGLGSTDNLFPMIQPFYYTSRYVHNHVLQAITDMGVLGVLSFLVFLGGVFWLLLRALWRERSPLAALLMTCWVMMNTHSLMEINFSLQSYLCAAYVLLCLPVVLYAKPLTEKAAKTGGMAVCAAFWLYLAVFGGLMGLRQTVQRESETLRAGSLEELMSALDSYARRDVFDPAPYQLEYVATAAQNLGGPYDLKMQEYVEKIHKSGNYPACSGLLEYYYLEIGDLQGLFQCSRECLAQRASYADVWNEQMDFYRTRVLSMVDEAHMETFLDGVLSFRAYLEETNGQPWRMEEIVLTEENQAFIDLVSSAALEDPSGKTLYQTLTGRTA